MQIKLTIIRIIFLFALSSSISFAQIGINTSDPKGLLHIAPITNSTNNNDSINNNVIFSDDGNLGIGTTNPKAKLDVEGSMSILKSSTEKYNITNYLLTSDAQGVGTWQYNDISQLNKISSFNIEMSVKDLFTKETRFTLAQENPVIINDLNLSLYPSKDFFGLINVPKGVYSVILNIELVNANTIASFFFSTTSLAMPISSAVYSSVTLVGKKTVGSWLINLTKEPSLNYIYVGLAARNIYLIDWSKVTYWNVASSPLPNGELYKIKGRIDIIKLG